MTYFEELTNTRQRQSNNMAASISSQILQIRKESIKQSLSDLNTISHRQQYIATVEGVMYYDDSRAENVNATWFTFQNIVKPVVWIAGGDDSKADFNDLKGEVKKKVRALVCIGKGNARLKKAFAKDVADVFEADNMEDAVKAAALLAESDDIVLFSPACKLATEDFAQRGDSFIDNVKRLQNEHRQ